MNRRLAAISSLLCFGAAILLLLQSTGGFFWKTIIPIPNDKIELFEGNVYRIGGGKLRPFLFKPHRRAALLENETPLPISSSSSQRVKEGANGTFTIGSKNVWFKTTDGSDPRTNGRTYEMLFPSPLPAGLFAVLLLLFAGGANLGCQAACGASLWTLFRTHYLPNLHRTDPQEISDRMWGLDLIRGLAIGLVLLGHAGPCAAEDSKILHAISTTLGRGGWIGVDLFFVLSGYLVSGLLWSGWRRDGRVNVGRFLLRRGFKIYPAYWVMTAGTLLAIAGLDLKLPAVTIDGIIGEFLFLQYYVRGIWGPTWTLAVEEHFYFLLALLFVILAGNGTRSPGEIRTRTRFFPVVFASVALVCVVTRCVRMLFLGDAALLGNYAATHTRLDSLMFGVLLQYFRGRWPEQFAVLGRKGAWWWTFAGFALFAPAFIWPISAPWMYSVGFSVNYLAGGCFIMATATWEQSSRMKKACAPLCALGRDSYCIYLWNMPAITWLATPVWLWLTPHHRFAGWLVSSLLGILGSVLVGILMGVVIERPFLRLRDQWFPSGSGAGLRSQPGNAGDSPPDSTREKAVRA